MNSPHIFHNAPYFVLSPHIGGVTSEAYISMGVGAARNVLEVLARQ
jgi:D-3-phosphoglycerate dehydrogenase